MVISTYMSDAQELIAVNDGERARQYINIAKMLMFEFELGFANRAAA